MTNIFASLLLLITLATATSAGKLCCSATVKIQKFLMSTNSGHPAHLDSGKIFLLDSRRAIVTDVHYRNPSPFGFWVARLRSQSGSTLPLDQLGDYRDSVLLAASGRNPCERFIQTTKNVTLILPMGRKWKDVAWLGIYDFGYKFLLNYVWVNPEPSNLRKFDICLNQPICWSLPEDPTGCHMKLKPCKDMTIDCARPETFCYRECEGMEKPNPVPSDEIFHCGATRRAAHKLFGCGGTSNSTQGSTCG